MLVGCDAASYRCRIDTSLPFYQREEPLCKLGNRNALAHGSAAGKNIFEHQADTTTSFERVSSSREERETGAFLLVVVQVGHQRRANQLVCSW